MAEYVIMPKLGFNMDKGKIVKWLKKEGEIVKERESILQIETDKTVMDVEASIGGVLRKIFLGEGSEVPVTLPIGIIAEKNENIEKLNQEAKNKLGSLGKGSEKEDIEEKAETINLDEKKEEIAENGKDKEQGEVKISPRAKKLAKESNIDLNKLKVYKAKGIVSEKDVEQFQNAEKKDKVQQKAGKRIPYTGIRKIIGDRLSQSKFTAPHVYFSTSVDMHNALDLLNIIQNEKNIHISVNDLIVFITAKVLFNNNQLNVSLENEIIKYHSSVNIGIAASSKNGLIVPVIRNADTKSLFEISEESKKLIKLARDNRLLPEDYSDGTFTISNLGMYGVEEFTAIINPPESAILTVGSIQKIPIVDEFENIIIKPILKMTLSVDHRIIDGQTAAIFLQELKKILINPGLLFI